ncbi:flagellar export chaperone FliS [Pseudodesulfovibrio sp. F-1]|uniref:Flagellar export chaperone FliS n=1 Tax=Pseudodesulfovibrio alkaliphilus TaxID=2661613 RepID=A0A7K1KJ86_9BACT|nr:flagellar export chaperone FliS [Pseudodesulfovibrio alkaliphilus]MUM76129.1 flagellar export chaperone FliS [Pseudodesulfovibrio alkaliphilus]
MTNPARAYLTTQVETTTQGELLIMLYDAAIKFLKRARIEMENKDYAKKGIYISKAMAIIHELAESLNKEKGGDITPKLNQLYMFCTSQLLKANIRMDIKMIDDVIRILDGLRSAYAQIIPGQAGKSNPAQTVQRPAPPPVPGMGSMPAMTANSMAGRPQATSPAAAASTPSLGPAAREAAQPAAPEVQAGPEQSTQPDQKKQPQQAPPSLAEPPKLRTAFNAAKLRAANAYTNNNR